MKNTEYGVLWILTHIAFNCNNFFDLGHFSKFQDGIERKLDKLHFHCLQQILNILVLKVTIEVDQGASTFWMLGPLRIKVYSFCPSFYHARIVQL